MSNEHHATVDNDVAEPRRSYMERVHTPMRRGPAVPVDWDAERHAHLSDGVHTPRGLVERVPTPSRQRLSPRRTRHTDVALPSALRYATPTGRQVSIAVGVRDPPRTYLERLHTPRRSRSAPKRTADMTVDDWAAQRHARVDDRAATPRGFVVRPPTPGSTRSSAATHRETPRPPRSPRDEQASSRVSIAVGVDSPERSYVERIHTPLRHRSGKAPGDMSVEDWAAERHAHIDEGALTPRGLVDRIATPPRETPLASGQRTPRVSIAVGVASPQHTYVERITTPVRRASPFPQLSADAWDSERHARIDSDAATPRGVVERSPTPPAPPLRATPSRPSSTPPSAMAGNSGRRGSFRVSLAVGIQSPHRSYVESIHTPTRPHPGSTEEEWLAQRHAHIDDAAVTPRGYVERPLTPASTAMDGSSVDSDSPVLDAHGRYDPGA